MNSSGLGFTKRNRRRLRSWAALLVVMRALLVVFVLQFSGVAVG